MSQNNENAYFIQMDSAEKRIKELRRLTAQGEAITLALLREDGGLFPRGFTLKNADNVRGVDLACGAGEWARRVAAQYPNVEVIGVDLVEDSVAYSNAQAAAQMVPNAEFRVMNVLDVLDFEDDSADVMNMRFTVGVIPKVYWPTLLSECFRVLKPGGVLRLIEPTTGLTEEAPHQHEIAAATMRALYSVGKSFSAYEMAIAPALKRYLYDGGYVNIGWHSYDLDYSYGSPLYGPLSEDFIDSTRALKPLLLEHGGLSDDQFEWHFAGMYEEMHKKTYSAMFGLISFHAYKPM